MLFNDITIRTMNTELETVIRNLENYNNKSYLQYINNFAPQYASCISYYICDARRNFANIKHKDVDKYLYKPFFAYSENFGKLHRPLTCIAVYLACSNQNYKDLDNVFAVAGTIELFQTAALIHDDIADGAQLRRGKACLHKEIGEALAINVGDFGLSATIGMLMQQLSGKYGNDKLIKIIRQLIFMEYMTIEGQAMDLGWSFDNRFDISEDDYIVMATKKTAYYSASIPCVLAAICADCNDEIIKTMEKFGEKVGLAFQIQDDLLNLVGDENLSKQKDFRSDITEGKRTLIVCKALELCDSQDSKVLIDILKNNTTDTKSLEKAVDIMQSCGAIDYSKKLASALCDEAYKILNNSLDCSKWKDILLDMTNWAKDRKI